VLNSIQFFRALAAIMVMLFHLGSYFVPGNFEVGKYGVDIFFVVSGFVMAFIHHERVEKIKDFALKRVIRIYPTYLEILLIAVLILGVKKFDIGANLFFTDYERFNHDKRVLGAAWTLSYEIWFYVVFALSMAIFGKNFYRGILIFFLLTVLNLWIKKSDFFLSTFNFEFCFGVALCYFFRTQIINLDKKIKYNRIIILIGDASYSLYLLHLPLQVTLGKFIHKFTSTDIFVINLFWYMILISLVIGLSILNYLFVEKKMINFLRNKK
jgi:exopolysaccharide production protein ExoZ